MAKGKEFNKLGKRGNRQTIKPEIRSTDNETPTFSFKHVCNNHCQLLEWQKQELSQLVNTFKIMESLMWKEVRKHQGLNLHPISRPVYPLPTSVPEDAILEEVKVDEEERIFGYRGGRVFYLIWFDRAHEVCPENKVRRA